MFLVKAFRKVKMDEREPEDGQDNLFFTTKKYTSEF